MIRNSDNLNNFTELEIALASGQIRTKEHLHNIKSKNNYSNDYIKNVVDRMSKYQPKDDNEKSLTNYIHNCKKWAND
ncbi:hypothetical protein JF110_001653 [Campylobacter jejuni]|nr:hypothetical protein [Campylobacter jejuni]